MTILYITTLVLAFTMTLAPASQFLLDYLFAIVGIAAGYKTLALDIVLVILAVAIAGVGQRQGVADRLLKAGIFWLPWIGYLVIRSDLGGIGLWKLEMYFARVIIPCFTILTLYLADPGRFEKFFFTTLVSVAFVLVPVMYFADYGDMDFENNIWLSRLLAIVVLFLFLKLHAGTSSVLYYAVIIFCVCAMLFIGSRGPVLSLLLTVGILYLARISRKPMSIITGVVALGVALPLAVAGWGVLKKSVPVVEAVTSFLSHGRAKSLKEIENDRIGVYGPTLSMVAENPLIGVGLGNWSKVFYRNARLYDDGEYKYPHNFVLEILSELGVIGLLLFGALFIPVRALFGSDRGYGFYVLLGLLFAATSSDITQNAVPVLFGLLARARWQNDVKLNG